MGASVGGHREQEHTWIAAFEREVTRLATPGSCATLIRAFREVAADWIHAPVGDRRCMRSGITPDGSPVEISLQLSSNGAQSLRFIAQPDATAFRRAGGTHHLKDRARDFVMSRSGVRAAAFAEIMVSPLTEDAAGNFLVWLGLDVDLVSGDTRSAKLYVNPWATRLEHQGFVYVHEILSAARVPDPMYWLNGLALGDRPLYPSIVGVNFESVRAPAPAHDRRAVKTYFVDPEASLQELRTLARRTGAGPQFAPVLDAMSAHASALRGEVHVTLQWGGPTPVLRPSFLCTSWFRSGSVVLEMIGGMVGREHRHTLQRLAPVGEESRLTFVGLDPRSVTLYFSLRRAPSPLHR